ncbi:hypothetical protein A0H81_06410 [Grifola frondosa]|uniref:Uncharacterized protein n=1 Tax=Grifola frondosa TaxID=5627 RepID=A0A1C7M9E1_GRIFR|nr:hypothetical protein A0H81_06410 [Grifola frondosa]
MRRLTYGWSPAGPALTIQLTGPLVIGYQFNWALYGVLCVQMYIYSQAGMPDSRVTKGIILWIFTLETLQTITATHDSFHELALSWGNFESLTELYLTWFTLPVLTGVISATIQCFYAWRIYVLSTSRILTLVIVLIALMQGAAAMAEGIQLLITQNVQGTQEDTFKTTAVWLGGTAFCDILISFCMVLLLSRNRRAGSRRQRQ